MSDTTPTNDGALGEDFEVDLNSPPNDVHNPTAIDLPPIIEEDVND